MELDPSVNLFLKTRRLCLGARPVGRRPPHRVRRRRARRKQPPSARRTCVSLSGRRFERSHPGRCAHPGHLPRRPARYGASASGSSHGDDCACSSSTRSTPPRPSRDRRGRTQARRSARALPRRFPTSPASLYFRRSLREPAAKVLGASVVRASGAAAALSLGAPLRLCFGSAKPDSVMVRWLA